MTTLFIIQYLVGFILCVVMAVRMYRSENLYMGQHIVIMFLTSLVPIINLAVGAVAIGGDLIDKYR